MIMLLPYISVDDDAFSGCHLPGINLKTILQNLSLIMMTSNAKMMRILMIKFYDDDDI